VLLVSVVMGLLVSFYGGGSGVATLSRAVDAIRDDLRTLTANVSELQKDVRWLSGNMTDVRRELAVLSGNMTDVRGDINGVNGSVTELKDEVGYNMTAMSTSMEVGFKKVSGSVAYKRAEETRLQLTSVMPLPNKTEFTNTGSGFLVNYRRECYIGTAGHVLRPLNSSWTNTTIYFSEGRDKGVSYDRFTYYVDPTFDVGVIPYPCTGRETKVKDTMLRFGKELRGIATLDEQGHALYCHALERSANGTFIGDCGGSPGASGTAYLNRRGMVVGIHHGAGNYTHGLGGNETNTLSAIRTNLKKVCVVERASRSLAGECLDRLVDMMAISSRNPAAVIIPAHFLIDLLRGVHNGTAVPFKV
jgi:hypothetical protein